MHDADLSAWFNLASIVLHIFLLRATWYLVLSPIHRKKEAAMDTESIINEIDAEIGRLREVRAFLSGDNAPAKKPSAPAKKAIRRRRRMSPEARKRIADAQRKRWAAAKRATNQASKKTALVKVKKASPKKAAKRTLSAEARKRIADAQRKRWAMAKKPKPAAPPKGTKKGTKKASRIKAKTIAPKKTAKEVSAGALQEIPRAEVVS